MHQMLNSAIEEVAEKIPCPKYGTLPSSGRDIGISFIRVGPHDHYLMAHGSNGIAVKDKK